MLNNLLLILNYEEAYQKYISIIMEARKGCKGLEYWAKENFLDALKFLIFF